MVYTFSLPLQYKISTLSQPFVMQIGHLTLMIFVPLMVVVYSLALLLYLSGLRNKSWLLVQVLKQNTTFLLLLLLKSYGCHIFFMNSKYSLPLVIYCDNQSVVALSHNHVLQSQTKHMELDMFFVWEKVLNHSLVVPHILVGNQVVDILTKPISQEQFSTLRNKLNIIDYFQ